MDETAFGIGAALGVIVSISGLIAVAPQAPSGALAPPPVSHRMDETYNPRSNDTLCKELAELHASDPNMGLIEQAVHRARCQILLPSQK